MIQELLNERKISIPFSSPSSTPILTTTTTTTITTNPSSATILLNTPTSSSNPTTNNNTQQSNLKCPRCDSTNTKFCYYNNYNLTQPRHFCKTCRRYWTKGGTLRNVPIGGGCRKNKSITPCATSPSNAMAKAKASLSSELLINGNSGFLGSGLLDHVHHFPDLKSGCPNPILWPSIPQSSHILSLLRGSTHFHNGHPNPNPSSNVFSPVKTENNNNNNNNSTTTLGLDSYGNGAPSNLPDSFPRSNPNQANGFSSGAPDFVQNNGNIYNNNSNILELYHKLKSSSSNYNYCGNENPGTIVLGNMVGSSTSPSSSIHSTVLDSAPVIGGGDHFGSGYGFMNSPAMISGWSDFSTVPINGAFP